MIIDDRMAICDSANINDRSLVDNRHSKFSVTINDLKEEDDRFNEEPVLAKKKLKGIQGFVFGYPIHFLDKENYLPGMSTHE
ncbi:unnamed protein product, partial [Rotaria sp. Silwood2]